MVVRLRLARWGKKHVPFYRIVAADARKPRDGKYLEIVGTYNPIAMSDGVKELRVNSERIAYWLSVGAQPSDRARSLFGLANILPMPANQDHPKKAIPKKSKENK